jgi:branched-chain amino acid transport system permease protein
MAATRTQAASLVARLFGDRVWIVTFLVIAAIPALIFGPTYVMHIFVTIAFFSIVAVSLDLLMGYGGLPTFGHTGFFAVGAYGMGILAASFGVPLILGIVIALGVSLLLALIIGVATLRLREYYFAVATLGFAVIVVHVIAGVPWVTGGWSGLQNIPRPSIAGINISSDLQYYWLAVGVLLVGLIVGRNFIGSRYGRSIRAIATDDLATSTLGIPVSRRKVQLFLLSAAYASISGSLYALYLRVPTPANFDIPVMIDMVLMLFLGGKETLWGPILGAVVVRFLPEVLGVFQDFRVAVQGLIFVLILIFMPRGLAGFITDFFTRSRAATVLEADTSAAPTAPALPWHPERPDGESAPILTISGISRRFGGLQAVDDVTFNVPAGRIKAVIGPNGAGKTTLFNLLSGVIAADAGSVRLRGREILGLSPEAVARLGVVRSYQTPRLFTSMTVLDNVLTGHDILFSTPLVSNLVSLPSAVTEERTARESALMLLDLVGLRHRADVLAGSLPFGERRLLEIARVLGPRPIVAMLDEPAAGLNESEKDRLGDLLLWLQDQGITLVLVEHDMRLVMRVADEVAVLNYGRLVADGPPKTIRQDPEVIRAYLGEEVAVAAG